MTKKLCNAMRDLLMVSANFFSEESEYRMEKHIKALKAYIKSCGKYEGKPFIKAAKEELERLEAIYDRERTDAYREYPKYMRAAIKEDEDYDYNREW